MSAPPRIAFSTVRSSSDPMLAGWVRFRLGVESATLAGGSRGVPAGARQSLPAGDFPPGPCAVWRVLAPNNREIARSALIYPSLESARAHVLRIRQHAGDLSIALVNGYQPGMHGFSFTLDGSAVLTCARWYSGSALGLQAALATLDAIHSGIVDETSQDISPGRRSAKAPVAVNAGGR